jgi:hypothetical protein
MINQTDPFGAEAVGLTDKLFAHFTSAMTNNK